MEEIKNKELSKSSKLSPDCGHKDRSHTLKLIPYNQHFVKFVPQIKESCGNCGKYIRFAPQTQEFIDKFNQKLGSIRLEGTQCG